MIDWLIGYTHAYTPQHLFRRPWAVHPGRGGGQQQQQQSVPAPSCSSWWQSWQWALSWARPSASPGARAAAAAVRHSAISCSRSRDGGRSPNKSDRWSWRRPSSGRPPWCCLPSRPRRAPRAWTPPRPRVSGIAGHMHVSSRDVLRAPILNLSIFYSFRPSTHATYSPGGPRGAG